MFSVSLRGHLCCMAADAHVCYWFMTTKNTVKPVLNGPFIKQNFVSNGNIFRSHDYHSIP
jgi:hypothetical protein